MQLGKETPHRVLSDAEKAQFVRDFQTQSRRACPQLVERGRLTLAQDRVVRPSLVNTSNRNSEANNSRNNRASVLEGYGLKPVCEFSFPTRAKGKPRRVPQVSLLRPGIPEADAPWTPMT